MLWDDKTDTFLFNVDELEREAKQTPVTKRQLLCIIASIFDRLSSFTVIKLKILFQALCISNTNWDEPLSGEALQVCNMISSRLQLLSKVTVPRCYYDLNHTVQWESLYLAGEKFGELTLFEPLAKESLAN